MASIIPPAMPSSPDLVQHFKSDGQPDLTQRWTKVISLSFISLAFVHSALCVFRSFRIVTDVVATLTSHRA